MHSYWRQQCAPIVARVLAENAGKSEAEVRAALRDAYPFGPRLYHPYRIWLDEISIQMGRRKVGGRETGAQQRPAEPPDPRQERLFQEP